MAKKNKKQKKTVCNILCRRVAKLALRMAESATITGFMPKLGSRRVILLITNILAIGNLRIEFDRFFSVMLL